MSGVFATEGDRVRAGKVLARVTSDENAAAAAGAHFVFLSSVKVHGEESLAPFTESSALAPADAYARFPEPKLTTYREGLLPGG